MNETTASPAAVLYSRIRWLINLRWFYGGILSIVALLGYAISQASAMQLFVPEGLALVWVGYNAACLGVAWRLHRHGRDQAQHQFLRLQLIIDMLLLLACIHFTGGWLNILLITLVFHIAVAASLLRAWESYSLAAIAGVAYVALCVYEVLWWFPPPAHGLEWLGLAGGFFRYGSFAIPGLGNYSVEIPLAVVAGAVLVPMTLLATVYFVNALISRLRRINHRLVEANRRLEGLDLAKSRFLRVSAHQLRSPLAAVHTMLSAVQEAGGLNHQQYEIVRKIQSRSEDAMTLVDEMMLLSTIRESAAEVRQLQPVEVDAAVREEVEAFSAEVLAKKLTVCMDVQSRAQVMAWEDALQTVLEHLISNAVKYTPSGGSVSIQTRSDEAGVEIKVADTGIGIPPEQQGRLFHEFFRATNARQVAGGTGMGLAIVHATVERLGGTISVESAQDKGTVVAVTLPVIKEPAADAAEQVHTAEHKKAVDPDKREARPEMPVEGLHLKPAK